jgi:hypothetical protein
VPTAVDYGSSVGTPADAAGFRATTRPLEPAEHSVGRSLAFLVVSSGVSAAICIPLGLVIALATCFRAVTVSSAAGIAHLRFGYPFHWLTQDQTIYTPTRFPARVIVDNPHHCPTQIHLSGLLADTAVWSGALLVGVALLFMLILMIRSKTPRWRTARLV